MHARPTPYVKRHPIRGAFFGLGMGLGIALILIGQAIIAIGTLVPFFVVIGGVVVGILYGTLMPPKGPKEPEPAVEADDAGDPNELDDDGAPDELGSVGSEPEESSADIADETAAASDNPDL